MRAALTLTALLLALPAWAGDVRVSSSEQLLGPPRVKLEERPGRITPSGARPRQPKVDVAFLLDCTGSMGGILRDAKRTIWSIATRITAGKPAPQVRIALIPFRDKSDDFVTQVFDLTEDIDVVYDNLRTLRARGGGDGPEHVNAALFDALDKLSWRRDEETLKLVFLVGDAPPHDDYPDTPTCRQLARIAADNGVRVNTVLCGGDRFARKSFEDIARAASGEFTMISLFGSQQAPATPLDGEIDKLSTDLRGRRARGMTSQDAEAKALTERIRKLVRERDAQVGAQGGFDEKVTETIRKQARNFGIAY
jgi:Mg-chelatase subunit ChlD